MAIIPPCFFLFTLTANGDKNMWYRNGVFFPFFSQATGHSALLCANSGSLLTTRLPPPPSSTSSSSPWTGIGPSLRRSGEQKKTTIHES